MCNTLNNVRPRTSCETIILSPNKDIEHKNNKTLFLTDFSISTCCGLCTSMSHLIEIQLRRIWPENWIFMIIVNFLFGCAFLSHKCRFLSICRRENARFIALFSVEIHCSLSDKSDPGANACTRIICTLHKTLYLIG